MSPRITSLTLVLLLMVSLATVSFSTPVLAAPDLDEPFLRVPLPEADSPTSVSVSDDGSLVALGFAASGNVSVYSAVDGRRLWTASIASGYTFDVELSGDGSKVFALSGGTVYMFAVSEGSVPVWSHGLGVNAFNIVTDFRGDIAVAGTVGAAHLFDENGYVRSFSAAGKTYMTLAMTPDGETTVGGCGDGLYLFDRELNLLKQAVAPGAVGSWWGHDPGIAISDDGQTVVASYIDTSISTKLMVLKDSFGETYYHTFGPGFPRFCLSDDGRTVLVADRTNLRLLDLVSGSLIWNRTLALMPSGVSISSDGSMALVSHLEDDVIRPYGKGSSLPILEVSLKAPTASAFSRDGFTMVVAGDDLLMFRPAIKLAVTAPHEVGYPGPIVLGFRATYAGEPVLGADVNVTVVGTPSPYYTVTELGDGYYQVQLYSAPPSSYQLIDLSVSLDGLGSASERVPVIVGPYVYNPYPIIPNYDYALYELKSQIGGLQGLVALLAVVSAVTMVVLILFVWKARRA